MWLRRCGFEVVPDFIAVKITEDQWNFYSQILQSEAKKNSYPIDGIVVKFDNKAYGDSLGATAHHRKNAYAYKFYDETYETTLQTIDWTMGKTGVLTPVAVFNEIEIENNIISRANLHNISIMKNLLNIPYVGEPLEIYRANQIIPQVYSAEKIYLKDLPLYSNIKLISIPKFCPYCGAPTKIEEENNVQQLYCTNSQCSGKIINILDAFCSKKGLDIKGLSKATLEKLIDWGWISEYKDIFELKNHKAEWCKKPGFGAASVQNKLDAIEKARQCHLENFLAAINIKYLGLTYAKALVKQFPTWDEFRAAVDDRYNFSSLAGFGEITCQNIWKHDFSAADKVIPYLEFIPSTETNNLKSAQEKTLEGQVFVITGKLQFYKNRDELTKVITEYGGKVSSSITAKTNYLINNDIESKSTKNIKAQSLNIPIISEQDFIKIISS